MTTLIIGDFDSEQMKKQVQAVFGQYPGGTEKAESNENPGSVGDWIDGQYVYDTVGNVNSTYLNFSFTMRNNKVF